MKLLTHQLLHLHVVAARLQVVQDAAIDGNDRLIKIHICS